MFWMVATTLVSPAQAQQTDITAALTEPRRAKWEPKGKAIGPFGRGDAKRKNEDGPGALPLLVDALERQPGCGKCLNSMAYALINAERYDDAVLVAEMLTTLFPDRDNGPKHLVDAREASMNWDLTVAAVDAALGREEGEPGDIDLWWTRNGALRHANNLDQAHTYLEGAEEAGLEAGAAACLEIHLHASEGDAEGARELWEACAETKNLDLRRYSEGWLAMAEGDVELAAKRLVLSGQDENLTRLALAFLRLEQEKPEGALNLATKMLEDGGEAMWDGWLAKAEALTALDRPDEAMAALDALPLAEGWAERHPTVDMMDIILSARGPDWPQEVARQSLALKIRTLAAQGDAEGAQALLDAAAAVHGPQDLFDEALAAGTPTEAPPEE